MMAYRETAHIKMFKELIKQLCIPHTRILGLLLIRKYSSVPNNEEIFNDSLYDNKFIVEIMELPNIEQGQTIAQFYFNDLSDVNEATESSLMEQRELFHEEIPNLQHIY